MASISVDYPDSEKDVIAAALKDFLGEDAAGLTDLAASKRAIRRFIKNQTHKFAQRTTANLSSAVAVAQAATVKAENAKTTAIAAQKTAESARRVEINIAFGPDS